MTDANDLAVMDNPNNPGEYVLYSLSSYWWRGITTAQKLAELRARGVPDSNLSVDIFDQLPQLTSL